MSVATEDSKALSCGLVLQVRHSVRKLLIAKYAKRLMKTSR